MNAERKILHYQREDDILYLTFGQEGRKGVGFNLHDNVLLRFERQSGEPLGLTMIDYSKLKILQSLPLNDASNLSEDLSRTVKQILLSDPVRRFIEVDTTTFAQFSVINPSMERVIAA
jgi:hypothetical protein